MKIEEKEPPKWYLELKKAYEEQKKNERDSKLVPKPGPNNSF